MTAKEALVVLSEDDLFARTWMELLLRRDWRTRVVGNAGSPVELALALETLKQVNERIDLVVIDTEIPDYDGWLYEVLARLEKYNPKSAILFTGVAPNKRILNLLRVPGFSGYVLKAEIAHSLAWAVSLACEGRFVVTPGVCSLFDTNSPIPRGTLILDGRKSPVGLTGRDEVRARLAFIFSMERHELADELRISDQYSYGVVSGLYNRIGLKELLEESISPEQYFASHPAVIPHLKNTLAYVREMGPGRVKDQETLAFHLLTAPEIDEVRA